MCSSALPIREGRGADAKVGKLFWSNWSRLRDALRSLCPYGGLARRYVDGHVG